MNILANNLNRFIGPGKMYSSNEVLAGVCGVGRSTIDRARKSEVALGVDKLSLIAKALSVEPWELLHPDLDASRRPIGVGADVAWPFDGVSPSDYAAVDPEERQEVSDLARSKVKRMKARAQANVKQKASQ